MDDYLKTFQNVNQSVEQLLKNQQNSSEIKQSAISLRKSIQPCLTELQQSAARLKMLLQASFADLDQAEDVWHSKPKIAGVATDEIGQKLDKLRKHHFRIRLLGSQCKRQAIKQAQASWKEVLKRIETRWFLQKEGQSQQVIEQNNNNIFIQEIRTIVNSQSQELIKIIKENLNIIYQDLSDLELDHIFHSTILNSLLISMNHKVENYRCRRFLDKKSSSETRININLMLNEIEANFRSLIVHSSGKSRNLLEFEQPFRIALQDLVNHGCQDISWKQLCRFKKAIYAKIVEVVTTVIDNRVEFAIKSIGKAILFYTDFLERQDRYQQETPQQRAAEKAWIDQQRQQLEQVYSNLEAILNSTSTDLLSSRD